MQDMTRENAAVQLAAYLEKARLDSVRHHSSTTAEMALSQYPQRKLLIGNDRR